MTTATKTEPKITTYSIIAVIDAIKGTGPRVDRETYKAHVPNFVTKTGDFGPLLEKYADARMTVESALNDRKPTKGKQLKLKEINCAYNNVDPKKIQRFIDSNLDIITHIEEQRADTVILHTSDAHELNRRCHKVDNVRKNPGLMFDLCVGYDENGHAFITNTKHSRDEILAHYGLPELDEPNRVYLWWD